jgi:Nif-specific regulatory protein
MAHRQQDKLAAILHICQQLNSERNLDRLLDLVAREATDLVDADRASIFLLDRERNQLWSKVALGSVEILSFDSDKGIAGAAVRTGEVINVTDAYSDSRFNQEIDAQTGYRTRNLVAVPLRSSAGEIVGVFEVLNRRHGSFGPDDEEVLKSLAAQAAIAIQTAQLIGELSEENASLRREVEPRRTILGNSAKIQSILHLVERIRDTSVSVLITGESGTGKELVAKAIHYSSRRSRKPFVALNCAALPENLVESELFGIEKGVATGVDRRIGQFEAAHSGTLFLDEIGDLSLSSQAKILRALQEKIVERVGGRTAIPVDVRVLAATNKDLESEIRNNRFREDLFYRLKVIHVRTPSLREIREDIPVLANHFLLEACREQGRDRLEISAALMKHLVESPWPGNVRQLENEIRRMVACARRRVLSEEDFADLAPLPEPKAPPAVSTRAAARTLKDAIEELERRMIVDTLETTRYNQQRAARALGLSRQGLINKIKRFGITIPAEV